GLVLCVASPLGGR
ncbi:hypothetical protein VCHC67A1_03371B, partial [Vibrio cholerae HC-67A1]